MTEQEKIDKHKELINKRKIEVKSADKMFEELGYKKLIGRKAFSGEELSIIYEDDEVVMGEVMTIIFDLKSKMYRAKWGAYMMVIDMDTHLAINQKLKELGWIE